MNTTYSIGPTSSVLGLVRISEVPRFELRPVIDILIEVSRDCRQFLNAKGGTVS